MNLVMPDPSKTLNEGAIEPWTKPRFRTVFAELKRFAKEKDIPLDVAVGRVGARAATGW